MLSTTLSEHASARMHMLQHSVCTTPVLRLVLWQHCSQLNDKGAYLLTFCGDRFGDAAAFFLTFACKGEKHSLGKQSLIIQQYAVIG